MAAVARSPHRAQRVSGHHIRAAHFGFGKHECLGHIAAPDLDPPLHGSQQPVGVRSRVRALELLQQFASGLGRILLKPEPQIGRDRRERIGSPTSSGSERFGPRRRPDLALFPGKGSGIEGTSSRAATLLAALSAGEAGLQPPEGNTRPWRL
jgi:hypothetical protein